MNIAFFRRAPRLSFRPILSTLPVLLAALALSPAAEAARLGHPDTLSPQPLQPGQPQPQPFVNRNPLPDITFGARPPVVEPPLPANRVPPSIYYDNPYFQPPQAQPRQWQPQQWQQQQWQQRREWEAQRWRDRQWREQRDQGWNGAWQDGGDSWSRPDHP